MKNNNSLSARQLSAILVNTKEKVEADGVKKIEDMIEIIISELTVVNKITIDKIEKDKKKEKKIKELKANQ